MFGLYQHPATRYICRHCRQDVGHDPEHCFYCGPICGDCFIKADKCAGQIAFERQRDERRKQEGGDSDE